MRLYLTCPHDGSIAAEVFALVESARSHFRARGWSLIWDPVRDRPTMSCRNNQVNRFRTTPCDRMVTLDSDCIPTRGGHPDVEGLVWLCEALDRPGVGVVGGWSLIHDEGRGMLLPCVVRPKGSNPKKPDEWPLDMAIPYAQEPIHDVTGGGIGTHCLAVKREVVDAMVFSGRIPFEDVYDRDPASPSFGCRKLGHDLNFCALAADLGYRVCLHNRVYWGHRKDVDLRWVHDTILDLRCRLEERDAPECSSAATMGGVAPAGEDDAA